MSIIKTFSALALAMTLASCGESPSKPSKSVPPAGDTLASACPEVMELMKQGADGIERANKERKISDPAYLDGLESVVKRLDEIEAGIKVDEDAAIVQDLANAYAQILKEQSDGKEISMATGKTTAKAVRTLSVACIKLLR